MAEFENMIWVSRKVDVFVQGMVFVCAAPERCSVLIEIDSRYLNIPKSISARARIAKYGGAPRTFAPHTTK